MLLLFLNIIDKFRIVFKYHRVSIHPNLKIRRFSQNGKAAIVFFLQVVYICVYRRYIYLLPYLFCGILDLWFKIYIYSNYDAQMVNWKSLIKYPFYKHDKNLWPLRYWLVMFSTPNHTPCVTSCRTSGRPPPVGRVRWGEGQGRRRVV